MLHTLLLLLSFLGLQMVDGYSFIVSNISVMYQYIPSSSPRQVHISYIGRGDYVVSWVSASPNDPSIVAFGPVHSNMSYIATGYAQSYQYQGYTSGGLHTVVLKDLLYSTTYGYTIDGRALLFTTVPAPGSPNVVFGVMADVGADPNSTVTINGLIKVREEEGMDAVIHAGDLSYANNYNPGGPVWDQYGDILEPLASITPYQIGVGNHEVIDNFTGFRLRYSMDEVIQNSNGGEFYYSVDIGLVHLIHLSSENKDATGDPFTTQKVWLLKDLQQVDRKLTPWIIAVWHRPWYCTNAAHPQDSQLMRQSLEQIFSDYKIDLVLNGHVHAYERTTPVLNFQSITSGTEYLVVGNGGTPEGLSTTWGPTTDWSSLRDSEWGYGRLKVVNATHAHWTMWRNSDGSILDQHWYSKSRN